MLEFNIRNQEISRIDSFSPAEKSVEYLIAKFNFKTEDWNDAVKRAIFRNVKSKVEKDTMLEDDSCVVPWEVLVGSSDIEISVHGVIGTEEITTNVAVFNLNRTLSGGSATQEPSPTVYEQMVEMVKGAKEVADSVRTDADNGKFNGEKGDNGKSAYEYAKEGGFEGTEQEFTDLMAQAGQVNLTGYVTKEEHEAELLKAMVKVTTDKAPYHHITDSANMKVVDFGMEGKTEQETVPGNQLFDVAKAKDPTAWSRVVYWYQELNLPVGTYTISFKENNMHSENQTAVDNQFAFYIGTNPGVVTNNTAIGNYNNAKGLCKTTYTFTVADGEIWYINVYKNGSLTEDALNILFEELLVNTMLNVGNTALPIEPYVGGQPSPNPDYPQEIELAGVLNEETGRYEHKCCVGNKNCFDKVHAETVYRSNVLGSYGGYPIFVGKGNTITISIPNKLNTGLGFYLLFTEKESEKNSQTGTWLYHSSSESLIKQSIKIISECDYIWMKIAGNWGEAIKYVFDTLQIEISDAATELAPHQSQQFTLTSDRPLTKWDYKAKRDGLHGWSINHYKWIFDGTENWKEYGSNVVLYNFEQTPIHHTSNGAIGSVSEHFREVSSVNQTVSDNAFTSCCDGTEWIVFHVGMSVDEWKAYLAEQYANGTPVYIIYPTAEEQAFIPLPDEEQELLRNLEMYYGVTNVYNEQGCPISITYAADQELHWNQKLLQIQQALI